VLEQTGAAVVIHQRELDGATLARTLLDLAGDEGRRAAMSRAARGLARPDAADAIVARALALMGA
jgi:UDP-N-acetylglucosamine:LPS N-acetylglucosamine transferase